MALFKNKNEKQQEDKEKLLVQKITRMYKNAYNSKAKYHEIWDKCYKAYTGELFKSNLPSYRSQEVSNFVFSTVESIKPIMLADNPKILALPQKEEFTSQANIVQDILDYEWQRAKMFSVLNRHCTAGLIFGTVPMAIIWDRTAQNGLGDVKPIPISPFNFFVDPMATSIDDAEYAGYATYKNVGEVIKSFPEKEEELKKATSAPTDEFLTYGKDTSDVNSNTNILYIEMYFRDYSMETEEVEEDGNKYKVSKPKYPNGRFVAIAGDVLLEDKENPYKDGKFPFVMWKCYDVPGRFWGMSEVEQIISPQQSICDLTNNILDSAKLMSNPIWVLDKNSGVDKNTLSNRNGLVIRKNPGTEVRREAPPALPAYIQNTLDMLYKHMEIIPGVYDVTRGERPSGITAGIAIQALTESAQGRIKLKVQALEQMLGELGGLWLSRIQQFWVTKRSVRTLAKDYTPSYNTVDKDDIDGDFDIIIASGSTMPVNKTAKLQQIIQMAQTMGEDGLPMVDRQTVLENADISNLEEVMQRFEAIKQQQQQQAQMQQQDQLTNQLAQQQISHEQDLESQQQAHEQNMESNMQNMALQNTNNGLQLNQDSSDNSGSMDTQDVQPDEQQVLYEIIKQLLNMPADEVDKLSKESPEIASIMEIINNMPKDLLEEMYNETQNTEQSQ